MFRAVQPVDRQVRHLASRPADLVKLSPANRLPGALLCKLLCIQVVSNAGERGFSAVFCYASCYAGCYARCLLHACITNVPSAGAGGRRWSGAVGRNIISAPGGRRISHEQLLPMTQASSTDYRIVIGLEVHVQLLTHTKLFCGCSTQFGLPPNSATCPVCIGMPGVLPVMNRRAFDLSLKAALALNCQIAGFTKWDRKNYYYPDLPKNYQISQYDLPFSRDGWLEIATAAGPKRIGIIRAHLEEDAGKLLHDEAGGGRESKVDLNRAGTPLLEIVSKPELSAPEEARAYLEEMRLLLREIEVSDCEMQEGSLRCDANINLHVPRPDGGFDATPIVEV